MKQIYAKCRAILCLLMTAVLLGAFAVPVSALSDSGTVTGRCLMFGNAFSYDYPYSDDYFRAAPEEYSHDLARLTLGLALAASRDVEHPDAQDDNLVSFFRDIGFSQTETGTYSSKPSARSIAYGIAEKTIGDRTVIACAVCGGNYSAEWASNLEIGNTVRAMGFRDSSLIVKNAIERYLKEHPVSGKAALWITGFSRGAAVANITAADFTESGIFDAVYAYTFATPRTTKEPVRCENIFNIIQKEDVVPKIPLADWGYERFGRDLYMVSPETDSDSGEITKKAATLYREITGAEMVFNSEINYELRTVMDYLLVLMQTSRDYAEYLQPVIVDIMTKDAETKDALQALLESLRQYSTDDKAVGKELQAMRDYLGTLINTYYLQEQTRNLPPRMWDPEQGTKNLFNGHNPCEYLAMMFSSDDPDELYSENLDYIRLVIYGEADIAVSDGGRVLKEILSDGTELVDGAEDLYSYPDAEWLKDKVVITLPADRSLELTVTSRSFMPQTITYTGLRYSGQTVRAKSDDVYSLLLNNGESAHIRTSAADRAIDPEKSDHSAVSLFAEAIYSPTTAMRLENNSVIHLTISGLVNKLLFILVLLLVSLIVSLVLMVIRRKKHTKRNHLVALVWHSVITAVFAILEVAMWYFVPVLPLAKMIPGLLAFFVIVTYAARGCRTETKRWKNFRLYVVALALYMVLESMLIGDFTVAKGILLWAVYALFIAAAYLYFWQGRVKKESPSESGG